MIEELIDIAKDAGHKILEFYEKDYSILQKSDQSPVTDADLASNTLIQSELSKKFPRIPIFSEESNQVSFEERKNWKEYFLVDPLDGTKEFIKKNGEFSVNIAFMKNNQPYRGVVVSPVDGRIYFAQKGQGSFLKIKEDIFKLPVRPYDSKMIKVFGSKSHLNDETKCFIESNYNNYELVQMGSSLKFCLIAEGKVDVYPRFAPTSEWDTAAAHIILQEAGGDILDFSSKKPLSYNKKDILNPSFIAFRKELSV